MSIKPLVDSILHLLRNRRINEVGCTNLNGRSTAHQELNGILGRRNAAQTNNRNVYGMSHIPNHAQGNRLNARTAQTTRTDAQERLALLNIHRHTHQGVDERNRIGTLSLHGTGDVGNAGNIRRKLHDEGFLINLSHCLHHAGCTLAGYTESHAAILHVRTGDVQLYGRNLIQLVDARSTLGITLRRMSAHVDNHIGINVLNLRINVRAEILHTLVLQTYAVEHALRRFSHTRIVVSLARLQGSALHDNTANLLQRNEIGKF